MYATYYCYIKYNINIKNLRNIRDINKINNKYKGRFENPLFFSNSLITFHIYY